MLNSTQKIKLDPAWEKRYKISRIFILIVFFAGMLWLSYLILFPSRYFSFSFLHPDSSKNNIVDLVKIENELIFNTVAVENFSKAKISFSLRKGSAPLENNKISVRKSYRAFFYPIGRDILSSADYSMNSLVSFGKSVFIVGKRKKFPIDNPLTFESAGFSWNNVEFADGKDLSQYEKQGLFNIHDVHPNGTVFLIKENEKYFYIKNKKKHELKGEALNKSNLQEKAILAEKKGLELKKECSLKKNYLSSNRYNCVIPIDELNSLVGKNYQFEVGFNSDVEVEEINIVLQKTVSRKNFTRSLSEIKSKIFLRYGLQQENI